MSSNDIYYTYAYLRKDLTPYYIGKGKEDRAWSKHHRVRPPNDKTRIVILEDHLTEIGALALERRMIRWYGRKDLGTGILHNMTDGGDGVSGAVRSAAHKAKISAGNTGRIPHNKGKTASPELRLKLSLAHLGKPGKPCSEENKEKMRIARKGKPGHRKSEETRKTMAAKLIGRPVTDKTRDKISQALLGRKATEEHKAKLREAWVRRKQASLMR